MKGYTAMKNLWTYSTNRGCKYHNQKTIIDGIEFDSKKEANRYLELKLLQKANKISNLRIQVPFVLIEKSNYGRAIKYIADFVYYDNDAKNDVIEDTKGYRTDVYKLKKRLLAERYNIEIHEL